MSDSGEGRRLLVAIPCLNEEATLGKVIDAVPRELGDGIRVDILVVDDGSSDGTSQVAVSLGAQCVRHSGNRGVGKAFQSALEFAIDGGYDYMANVDGDGQFDPNDIPKLLAPILEGKADMVTASRFLDKDMVPDMPKVKLYGNHAMSYLISKLTSRRFRDVSCGFRAYSRDALLHLNLHGAFTYTQETFLDYCVKNVRIKEVPIRVRYFADRKSRVAGSIFRYAFNTATIIFRGYRDYFPLKFFLFASSLFAIPASVLALVFLVRFFVTGKFSGYLFLGFTSAFMFMIAFGLVVLGVVADMLDRIRSNQERILYLMKSSKR